MVNCYVAVKLGSDSLSHSKFTISGANVSIHGPSSVAMIQSVTYPLYVSIGDVMVTES